MGSMGDCGIYSFQLRKTISADEGGEGGEGFSGIAPGQEFLFTLNDNGSFDDPDGRGGWVPDATFKGTANVPEPGTITFFLTGLGTLAAKRKFRRCPSFSA